MIDEMENSYFLFTDKNENVEIERFHNCIWEFNNSALVEFGFEVNSDSIKEGDLIIYLFIPWATKKCRTQDLYEKLSIAENSRFIFNDSVSNTISLDGGRNKSGVIHKFSGRNELCILPSLIKIESNGIVSIKLNTVPYRLHIQENKPNIYFRFWIEPTVPYISMRKKGINKSTIIYDIKVNERRNIPEDELRAMWRYRTTPPFVIRFLYVYSFPHRINMKELIDLKVLGGVNDPPRGFKPITKEQLNSILKATKSDESFIVD